MAVKELTRAEALALADTNGSSGVRYLAEGEGVNFYAAITSVLHHLDLSAFFALQVKKDDSNDTTIRVLAGRGEIDGVVLSYAGGTVDLAAYNNDTAYVWLEDSGGAVAASDKAADGTGWPAYRHVKLAEVTLASGAITAIVDRRPETALKRGIAAADLVDAVQDAMATYTMAITVQGSTAGASTITITLKDLAGNAIAAVDYLRVRVCNSAGYTNATNATIAAGANTTAVETLTANKDIVFQSHTDGTWKITLTDATAETVTLRIGPATLSARRGDYTTTQNVTHA